MGRKKAKKKGSKMALNGGTKIAKLFRGEAGQIDINVPPLSRRK